jgi:hypothetical protein
MAGNTKSNPHGPCFGAADSWSWARILSGILVLDVFQALQDQVQIGRFYFSWGEGACDDEASVARKMITGNQSLAVAVLVISIS